MPDIGGGGSGSGGGVARVVRAICWGGGSGTGTPGLGRDDPVGGGCVDPDGRCSSGAVAARFTAGS
jgi:hypothetical protein